MADSRARPTLSWWVWRLSRESRTCTTTTHQERPAYLCGTTCSLCAIGLNLVMWICMCACDVGVFTFVCQFCWLNVTSGNSGGHSTFVGPPGQRPRTWFWLHQERNNFRPSRLSWQSLKQGFCRKTSSNSHHDKQQFSAFTRNFQQSRFITGYNCNKVHLILPYRSFSE